MVIATVLAFVLGTLTPGSAGADDAAPDETTTSEPQPTPAGPTPADPPVTEPDDGESSDTLLKPLAESVGAGPEAVPESTVLVVGSRASVDVAANDSCPGIQTCTYAVGGYVPADWGVVVSPTGTMSFAIPAKAKPRLYNLYYTVTHESGTSQGYLSVAVTPDNFAAPSRMMFTHPYRKRHREKIRRYVLRSINSVPAGERIQLVSWSFASDAYFRALKKARNRGASVQIVLAMRNRASNSDYGRLKRAFGTSITPTGSWVRKCRNSCRGVGGTMHAKIFLFSAVYRTRHVMLTGSANLTDFAVTNQWNQTHAVSGNQAIYDDGVRIFQQLLLDRQASPMYVESPFPGTGITNIFYPIASRSPDSDAMYQALNRVKCWGATNTRSGRTTIQIAMYYWYQDRGKWLAKKVRQLWNRGCKVSIVYAVSSNPVKNILMSPSGRGRIPIRQILLANRDGVPIHYLHGKWVTIKGYYGADRAARMAFQGSINFSDIGFASDENFQILSGSPYRYFAKDFKLLWKDPQARAPSPVSSLSHVEGTQRGEPRLGTGVYRYLEAD